MVNKLNKYLRLIRFDKPIGTLLLLWPTLWALLVAYHGVINFKVYFAFIMGVFLTRSAGCAINDFADVKFDGNVARTKNRPLVSGELRRRDALVVTLVLSVLALIIALICLKTTTLLWTVPAFFIFVTYPFFKRFFPVPQLYLAIAFSLGILMAFVEAGVGINLNAILLFLANLFWVLAYDTIYALVDIKDDLKVGMKTSAITLGKFVIPIILISYIILIILMVNVAYFEKFSAVFWICLAICTLLIIKIMIDIKDKNPEKCFKAFLFNNYIGIVLCVGFALSYWLR